MRSCSKKRRKERKGEGERFNLHGREADCTADQFTGRDESGPLGEGEFIDFSRQVVVRNRLAMQPFPPQAKDPRKIMEFVK